MQRDYRSLRIVVAEDELEVRNYFETVLRCQGYAVDTAQDGDEVLGYLHDRADESSIQAVLLAFRIPGKDGLSVLREIRSFDKQLPVGLQQIEIPLPRFRIRLAKESQQFVGTVFERAKRRKLFRSDTCRTTECEPVTEVRSISRIRHGDPVYLPINVGCRDTRLVSIGLFIDRLENPAAAWIWALDRNSQKIGVGKARGGSAKQQNQRKIDRGLQGRRPSLLHSRTSSSTTIDGISP